MCASLLSTLTLTLAPPYLTPLYYCRRYHRDPHVDYYLGITHSAYVDKYVWLL